MKINPGDPVFVRLGQDPGKVYRGRYIDVQNDRTSKWEEKPVRCPQQKTQFLRVRVEAHSDRPGRVIPTGGSADTGGNEVWSAVGWPGSEREDWA